MAYPYNPKIAPAIGNGLGGFPQKAAAVASGTATTTGIKKFSPVGDPSLLDSFTSSDYFNEIAGGIAVLVNPSLALIPWKRSSSGNYYITSVAISSTGVTVLAATSFGTTDTGFRDGKGFSDGTDYYYVDSNILYKLVINGAGTITRSTISSAIVPATGTLTVSGMVYNYSTTGNSWQYNHRFNGAAVYSNGDGTASIFQQVLNSTNSYMYLACFVINTSGTIIRSFLTNGMAVPSTLYTNYCVLNLGQGKFSIFIVSIGQTSTTSCYVSTSYCNSIAGTYTSPPNGNTTFSAASNPNTTNIRTLVVKPNKLAIGYILEAGVYRIIEFGLDDNYYPTGIIAANSALPVSSTAYYGSDSPKKYYHEYKDTMFFESYLPNNSSLSPVDRNYVSSEGGSTFYYQYYNALVYNYTPLKDSTTTYGHMYNLKYFNTPTTDLNTNAWGTPFDGGSVAVRVSENSYIGFLSDANSTNYRKYIQLFSAI